MEEFDQNEGAEPKRHIWILLFVCLHVCFVIKSAAVRSVFVSLARQVCQRPAHVYAFPETNADTFSCLKV